MQHQMMGDLPGHIFPGLAFVAWAAIWCVALLRRGGNASARPWDWRADPRLAADGAATAPWESWLKIVIPLVEIGFELRWVTWPVTDASATIYAHIAADVAVILSGVADLLAARGRLPRRASRVALAVAFAVPSWLFAVHNQHGPVATTAHQIFAGLLGVACALILIEMLRPAPLVRWSRAYFVALAGAWFMHTGWLLYVSGRDVMSAQVASAEWVALGWYALALAAALGGALALSTRSGSGSR